jgi:NAD(P)-dependent dehydrogenase (short-subunit alcohol dehydrogenase family)
MCRTEGTVVGLHRPNSMTPQLLDLQTEYGSRLVCLPIDLEQQSSIDATKEKLASLHPTVDMLFNVAGILGDGKTTPGPERSIETIDREWLTRTMDINCIGHVMLTKALVPSLKKKKDATHVSKIINLSARVGSIGDNSLGGWYSYRMSKASLNMFTKTCSVELKRYITTEYCED